MVINSYRKMIAKLKRLFRGNSQNAGNFYELKIPPNFEKGYVFSVPNQEVYDKLECLLVSLPGKQASLNVERPLKDKARTEFSTVRELVEKIKKDLKENFSDYNKEFDNEPLGFIYCLGEELLFSNSVEIIQKIYHTEVEMGDLYYFMVVKFNNQKFIFWKW